MRKPYMKDRRGEERHTALKRDPIGVGVGAGGGSGGGRGCARGREAESGERAERAAREAAEAALNGDEE